MTQNQAPILITGAGQRLGLHCAKQLVAAGYAVVVSYRKAREGIEELQALGVDCIQADFSEQQGPQDFIVELKRRHTRLRGVIHNASSWLPDDAGDPVSIIEQMLHIHAKVPFLLNTALAENIEEGGDIIHISDFVAQHGNANYTAYAASKAAMENMTFSFARRLAPRIKVNCIAPALMLFNDDDDPAYRKKAVGKSLLGIEPGAAEFSEAVLYLLQSRYVNGRVLSLDGGRHLKAEWSRCRGRIIDQ